MFAYKRTLIAVITLLVGAFSFFLARQFTDNYEFIFWFNVSTLWLAEIFVALSIMTLMKTDQKGMPFQFIPLMVAIAYFIFTLIVPLICLADISNTALVLIHCAGLILAVIAYTFSGMAHQSSVQLEDNQKKSFSARTSFRNDLDYFKMRNDALLTENAELNRKYMKLRDAFQYASDSIPGSEDADSRITDELKVLIGRETPESMEKCIDNLLSLAQWRESVIKNSR
ncbi:MAG: hypothetical protein E7040_08560 [Lentisphaerae bacterium]|nr:hypothetical protein [Lentisphaerota bacterium]